MKQQIKEILTKEFNSVYCDTCKFNKESEEYWEDKIGYWGCDDCRRKNMGWELSDDTAERLAEEILKKLG